MSARRMEPLGKRVDATRTAREYVLRLLGRVGLLGAVYRAYVEWKSLWGGRAAMGADGLPLPPAKLWMLVAGTADPEWFLRSGRLSAESIVELLARNGRRIEDCQSILDFGCGCGRVVRQWHALPARIAGSDYNPQLIAWCRRHLPFARFEVNGLAPPLAFDAGTFDLAYALSVFTHLPEDLQFAWIDELRRVVRPGGLLMISTHGETFLERLSAAEQERFRAGEMVIRWQELAGSNLCCTYHPPAYVRERLARGFEVVDFVPDGARGNGQDLFLLRRG